MIEQETNEKIINILNATEISLELSKEDIHTFADALIAAGIGDVKTAREIGASATAMAVLEAAKTEHRAARAERGVEKVAENITCEDWPFFSDWAASEKMEDFIHSKYCFSEYLKQAEKELAEENDGKKEV